MKFDFLTQAAKFLQERKAYRRWLAVFMCLALAVTFGTVAALKMYGQAMTHQVKVLECQYKVHEHTEDCYEKNEDGEPTGEPVCGYADYVVHTHNDDCYDENKNLVCPLEEIEKHEHDDGCYEEEEILVCGEDEAESTDGGHEHTDACYTEVKGELICEASGEDGHTHDESCYSKTLTCDREEHTHDDGCYEKELVCDNEDEDHAHDDGCYEETFACDKEEHEHGDDCYSEELTCGQEESGGHEHTDDCYEMKKELTCEEGEGESKSKDIDGHTHDEDCYKTEKNLTCGELELHTHTEALEEDGGCYDESAFDEDGEFIEGSRPVCGIPQLEEHVHTAECFKVVELTGEEVAQLNAGGKLHVHDENCYDADGNLICEIPAVHVHGLECYDEDGNLICGSGWPHTHDESCYDENGNLVCGLEETHVHSEACYDENGNLICKYQEEEETHAHDANCYDADGNLTCGYEDAKDHEHDGSCYDAEGNLTCGYEGVKDHEHTADCYDIKGNLICGYEGVEDHVHSEACYDEEGNLICGYELREEYTNSRIFENEKYVVIAKYNDDANIPEEAELLVEEITPDSDKEYYARRETEYREMMGDEMASMRALLKIGFYMETEGAEEKTEIEPATPVMISVQFLGEDGLPDGSPVTIIHFAEDGTEMLDGGSAVDNSTTFKMESFSEIAIICKDQPKEIKTAEDGTMRLHLSDTFKYEDDAFQISFHVEGEAIVPQEEKKKTIETEDQGQEKKDTNNDEVPTIPEAPEDAEILPDSEEKSSNNMVMDLENEAAPDSKKAADNGETVNPEDEIISDVEEVTEDKTSVIPESPVSDIPKLKFNVELANEESEEYKAFQDYAKRTNREDELLRMCVLTYTLTYGDAELDLSDCKVTAEIDLTPAVKEQAKESTSDIAEYLLAHEGEVIQSGGESVPEVVPYMENNETETNVEENADDVTEKDSDSSENKNEKEDADAEQTDREDTDSEGEQKIDDVTDDSGSESQENDSDLQTEKEVTDVDEKQQTDGEVNEFTITVTTLSEPMNGESVVSELEKHVYAGSSFKTLLGKRNAVNLTLSGKANPSFTVQYYANLSVLETKPTGTNGLDIIDTSGKAMPQNGVTPKLKYFQVDSDGNIKYKSELISVYKQRTFEYSQAPSLMYFDILSENDKSYTLKEVWKLKDGKSSNSTDENDWEITIFSNDLHFTNRQEVADKNKEKKYIVISDKTVLRLVYDTIKDENNIWKSGVTFYDYDISDGDIYKSASKSGGTKGRSPAASADNKWYMYTQRQGINSDANYSGKGSKLAFGNGSSATTLENEKFGKNTINQANRPAFGNGHKLCTFGMVKGLDANGNIKYADGIQAPPLFDEDLKNGVRSNTEGKSTYTDKTLDFTREGDTYTLTAVGGTSTNELEKFKYSMSNWDGTLTLYSNEFWPMDKVPSAGSETHDAMCAPHSYYQKGIVNVFNDTTTHEALVSDWEFEHNPFFGMKYTVKFKLAKDYIGPLEYYFFGDDDMWVFLSVSDPITGKLIKDDDLDYGKLICDIGGVHNSVGEYVNLWDYISKDENMNHEHTDACYDENAKLNCAKEYTLSFYYTERGSSGSTCWMQYTLPSVTSMNPEQETGQITNSLKVGKMVENASTNEQYEFEIHFTKPDNSDLPDDYSYSKFKYVRATDDKGEPLLDKDGRPVYKQKVENGKPVVDKEGNPVYEVELVGRDYLIHDGDTFTLGDGEYIIINYLPKGTKYYIEEVTKSDKYDVTINDDSSDGSINADITQDTVVNYVNEYIQYELPETGGSGTDVYATAGALLVLFGAGFVYKKKFRERRV